ncbi:MAG: heavy-metal-associated domain-containing protein [Clostridia bacterium]|nr:heavy-metal-associated domain-containing protein [Clostridia bacterium]
MFEKTQTVTLGIEGMMCKHCVARVSETLKACKGVKKFSVSLEDSSASVTFAPSLVSSETIARAVSAAGYPAKVI